MISIIVPIYRVAPYLRQCVASILCQTYKDIEVLLIDDGSPDECGDICEEYKEQDTRIKVFHTENRGLSAARNLGLKAARGEFLGFVDSDDWIESDMYEVLLKALGDADISVCGYDSCFRKVMFREAVYKGYNALNALLDDKFDNNMWNKLYRRKLFDDLLFPEGKNFEDIAVMHRIVRKANSVVVIPMLGYHYRVREGSITKIYTAKNLMDYADSKLDRYFFIIDECSEQHKENQKTLLLLAVYGISKVWRWWYGCSAEEKRQYGDKIAELHRFTKENIPLFGYRSWPISMRLSAIFMHSSSNLSFAVLYVLNQIFRKLWPEKANVV